MRHSRTLAALFAVLASGLCLAACSADDPPSLSEAREFRAYPVYYSGESVAGNSLTEVLGEPTQFEDERDTIWVFTYGRCKDPPEGEGGCPSPLSMHSYSTCTRWAKGGPLIDLRGAKATRLMPGGGASLEIFTGRTTVTIHAESQAVLQAAVRALRDVRQKRPSRLPPPAPGSLQGRLPCQDEQG